MLCVLHRRVLREHFGSLLVEYQLPQRDPIGWQNVFGALKGHIDGVGAAQLSEVLGLASDQRITDVFLDGSNLGQIAASLSAKYKNKRVWTFFHNVEYQFFLDAFKRDKSLRSFGVLIANRAAERAAVDASDRRICLNERDSQRLGDVYGKNGTDLFPMALSDRYLQRPAENEVFPGDYVIFVGGAFYANIGGASWFAENVSPYIPQRTVIVGRGMDDSLKAKNFHKQVSVVGSVEDLQPWYANARAVVAPIFDGSGMKTKVAEALMYGRPVYGTSEAFKGYEAVLPAAGKVCNTDKEFISELRQLAAHPHEVDAETLRMLYENNFSFDAALTKFRSIYGQG